jgi:glucose/arabinose dehydrogenase
MVGVALAGCGGHSAKSPTATQPAQTGTTTASATAAVPPMRATGSPAVVASGIPYAANLAFDAHGGLWVISAAIGPGAPGKVWYVPPGGSPRGVTTGLAAPSALAWIGNRLYVADTTASGSGRITVFEDFTGNGFTSRRVLLSNLPVGSHTIGSIVQGPGGRLFIGLGAQADHSGPPGRVVSFPPSGGAVGLEATGLRTAFGLAFWGRNLLVTDNGADHVSPSPDQLLAFDPGGPVVDFGFPKCYGQGGPACAGFRAPLATFPSHSSPEGIAVKGDVAFVADDGTSIVPAPAPSAIVRVDLRTGRHTIFWRAPHEVDLVGIAIGPDGDLYATLLVSGQVVRFGL